MPITFQMLNSQTAGLWRRSIKKELDIMRSILRPCMMIIKTPQNVHKILFWVLKMILTCEVKCDLIKHEPHYVKFLFRNLLHSAHFWLFDIWHIISNSLKYVFIFTEYVSLRLCMQNVVFAQPCVGKIRISLVLLNFLHCNFRLWFETP